jgi:hypothetical protein
MNITRLFSPFNREGEIKGFLRKSLKFYLIINRGENKSVFKKKFKILSHYVQTSIKEKEHTSFKYDSTTHNH